MTGSFKLGEPLRPLARKMICLLTLTAACWCGPAGVRAEEPASGNGAIVGNEAIARGLQPFIAEQKLAGVVAVAADKDRVLSLDCLGYADIADGRPMQPQSLFWIASMTKPITGAALMLLVDEGKVRLDDPVAKFLPEFKDLWLTVEQDDEHILLKRPARPITVRDIMSHTAGMSFKSPLETPTLDGLPLADTVRAYAMLPLEFAPGSKYQYSNAGINTGGRIIEVVSGLSYEEFLQQRLFDPLGMKDTTFWPNAEQAARIARSYKPQAGGQGLEPTDIWALRYPLTERSRHPMPGGGLFSTAADLTRFCQMVLRDGEFEGRRILSPEAVREMTRKQTPDEVATGYGVGWAVNGDVVGHGGAYATNMSIDRGRGLITIFLVQHSGFPGNGRESLPAFRKAAEEQFRKRP